MTHEKQTLKGVQIFFKCIPSCMHNSLALMLIYWRYKFTAPCIQTGSGAHPAPYPMGTGGSFPGGNARPERDANHSPPSSAEVKNE
jgi:hypothetical protein